MNKKKKIVLVIPTLHAGGMERVMCELASYFSGRPYLEVHLVLYGIKREIFYQLPPQVIVHQPSVAAINSIRLLRIIKIALFLRKKITSLQPDAVLSFGEYWNSFVLLSLLGKKVNLFVSDRCQPHKYLGFFQEKLRKWLYRYSKGIIAQTQIAGDIYREKLGHPNITVMNNPIRNVICTHNVEREKIVLTVGRLIKTKHHDELIRLFCKINKPGWKLVIVGDDIKKQHHFKRLTDLIHELEAGDKVVLKGSQRNVDEYYCNSSIFAFASSSEGFPNVVGEAQVAGLPVVAFDCQCGPAEMITDNVNGFLVPLFDYDLFQQKLQLLMEDEELRIRFGGAAKESVKKFALELQGPAFEEILLK